MKSMGDLIISPSAKQETQRLLDSDTSFTALIQADIRDADMQTEEYCHYKYGRSAIVLWWPSPNMARVLNVEKINPNTSLLLKKAPQKRYLQLLISINYFLITQAAGMGTLWSVDR